MKRVTKRSGFSAVELLAMIIVLVLMVLVFVPYIARNTYPGQTSIPQRIECVNNLKNLSLAIQVFEAGHNGITPGDLLASNRTQLPKSPAVYFMRMLSNELPTAKLLICPNDPERNLATSPTNVSAAQFSAKNISYFASITADETTPNAFLAGDRNLQTAGQPIPPGRFPLHTNTPLAWTKEMHNQQGNIAMGDGSVRQTGNSSLQQLVARQRTATNLLLIP